MVCATRSRKRIFVVLSLAKKMSFVTELRRLPERYQSLVTLTDSPPPVLNPVLIRVKTCSIFALGKRRVAKLMSRFMPFYASWVTLEEQGGVRRVDHSARRALKALDADDEFYEDEEVSVEERHVVLCPNAISCSEFLHEVLVGVTLSRELLDTQLTPHITRTHAGYVHRDELGWLVMQRAASTLRDAMLARTDGIRLTDQEVAEFYFQVLHTLAVAQGEVQFKHHDLHPHNVFLHKVPDDAVWRGQALRPVTHLKYTVGSTAYYLPKRAHIAQLADFGFASLVDPKGVRLQRLDIENVTEEGEAKWGEFTPELEGREGYDAQILFGSTAPGDTEQCGDSHDDQSEEEDQSEKDEEDEDEDPSDEYSIARNPPLPPKLRVKRGRPRLTRAERCQAEARRKAKKARHEEAKRQALPDHYWKESLALKNLERHLKHAVGGVLNKNGRPTRVSKVPPEQVLSLVFGCRTPYFNFQKPPPEGSVVLDVARVSAVRSVRD
jgi:hypothetical protein